MNGKPPTIPDVCDEDIAWACRTLGLPPAALAGADGNDPRLAVIKSFAPLDVEACPGSGKTTLLVAKLAILARHWMERRRGICVLSHTNVARREIGGRLGGTSEGKRLLSYPHFVGTIHGFVNEYLALPWLRSKPYPVRVVDDDLCLRRRWHKLPHNTRVGLEKNGQDSNILRLAATDFSVGEVRWGKGGVLGTDTDTYRALQAACRESCEEGYFCHAEMFLWAGELLDCLPQIRQTLRERFPLLFIDEVQDTSWGQSELLYRVFMQGDHPVVRQRFGDFNQAIYQYSEQSGEMTTDPFPDAAVQSTIPNSYRFGQQIADLANPLAAIPVGLVGLGPRHSDVSTNTNGKHAVFLFNDQTVGHVIQRYASYLLEIFSEAELQSGTFAAVGAVHRPGENNKLPRFIAHHWPDYDHELAVPESRPGTFLQYLASGLTVTRASGEAHYAVEKIAEGILRLASVLNPQADIAARKRKHRQVRELLANHPEAGRRYIEIVSGLIAVGGGLACGDWSHLWVPQIKAIAAAIAGTTAEDSAEVTAFLSGVPAACNAQTTPSIQRDNVFRFPAESPRVQVRVGSIHSVKGETHMATLVLDTFFYKHHLAALKPWLTGASSSGGAENERTISRLKQHYVAMTRPSHLLCLAMREDCLSNGDISALQTCGWLVGRVDAAATAWL